ncbi:MAG: DUF3037 domain-containing protein [Candidatus Limnocylindrales bacterium]
MERAEFINAGVVLFCCGRRFLGARTGLDGARLSVLAPDCDADEIVAQLSAIERVSRGDVSAGPIAALPKAERFHWLASPSSTIVQRSVRPLVRLRRHRPDALTAGLPASRCARPSRSSTTC